MHGIRKCGQQMNLLTMFTKTAINLSVALCKGVFVMPRQKKDAKILNIRLATTVSNSLEQYCEDSGQTKTVAVERALTMFIEDYYYKKEKLAKTK